VQLTGDDAMEWLAEECGNGEMRERTSSVSASAMGSGVMHDVEWRLVAGQERCGEAEVEVLRQGRSDRQRLDIAVLSTRAHGSVVTTQGVAWHMVPGGVNALTGGPRCRIEESDRWDPTAENFWIKNTSKTKIAQ
jgi:hypothetical protein